MSAAKAALGKNQLDKAQQNAQQAYQHALTLLKQHARGSALLPVSLGPEFLQTLIELLLAAQLTEEAVNIGQLSQERYPNNAGIIQAYAVALKHLAKYCLLYTSDAADE